MEFKDEFLESANRGGFTLSQSHPDSATLPVLFLLLCVRDLVQNGVVCPGADAELAALHPHRVLFTVSEMRAANRQPQRRLQQLGKTNFTHVQER